MGHDFYRVVNIIINKLGVNVRLTVDGDDICKPFKKYSKECTDSISYIPGFTSKTDYNRALDQRMIEFYNLDKETYTAEELCSVYYRNRKYIYDVWKEEDMEITERRYELFTKGAMKYLNR